MRWPLQPLQPFQQTQLQPPFGQSVDSLCHPWFTTTNVSYRFPILKLRPPPCAVLLVCIYIYIYRARVCACLIVLLIPLSLGHHIVCGVQVQIGRRKLLADVGGKRWKPKWCWRSTGRIITDDFTWQNNTPLLFCWLVGQFPCSNKQFATLWSAKASWFTHEWENQIGYSVSIHSRNSHRFIFTQTTVSNCLAAILLPGIFTPCLNQKNVTTLLILISVSLIIDLTATHMLHVWNIYQHLPHKWPKCR